VQVDIQSLTNSNQQTRWRAARSLREKGPAAAPALFKLVHVASSDTSIDVRVEAVLALGEIGKADAKAVSALGKLVRERDNALSAWAVIALGDSGPAGKGAIATIIEYLKATSDPERIFVSIETLGRIGPDAREAVPIIEKYVNNHAFAPEHGEVSTAAKEAIRRINKR
jgi:HEAT repeat protein